jgi:oligogalacturonide lyase
MLVLREFLYQNTFVRSNIRAFARPGEGKPMKLSMQVVLVAAAVALSACTMLSKEVAPPPPPAPPQAAPVAASEPPTEWVDKDTGHRVVRLSTEPGTLSLYFHQNAYTPQGDVVIVNSPGGIEAIDLKTRAIRVVVAGKVSALFVGRKTRRVYYMKREGGVSGTADGAAEIYAADIDTGATREVGRVPHGSIVSINANETMLLGSSAKREFQLQTGKHDPRFVEQYEGELRPDGTPYSFADAKERRMNARLEARIPMEIFTLDMATRKLHVVSRSTDWLNHLQFSPTDPGLIMFCHEGPWHKVDRIWTIRTNGSGLTLIHKRRMNMEIAGHESFSPDGTKIFYDLQTPRGQVFWLASYDLKTKQRVWRHLERNEWSVHFNVSRDGTTFSGDGGDSEMVAHAPDGKWLYLFHSEPIPDVADIHAADAGNLIKPEVLRAEKLVNMHDHDYRLEPNMSFTPDGKWIIFRSNMQGTIQVYAVEIARATP